MTGKTAVVVTSISNPNSVLQTLAKGCLEKGFQFIVIGDVPSPPDFQLEGCDFYSLERQAQTAFEFAKACPTRHYARKNLGYLIAIANGAEMIVETDDDNFPYDEFWHKRARHQTVPFVENSNWLNVYKYFSDANIWSRGLPLEYVNSSIPSFESLPTQSVDCPIQQGLADENPDVDAIYRLILPLPQSFRKDRRLALKNNSWSPFNSQNTSWWQEAFSLLYLPAYCSFRMTDIWRSFVAQRIAWANDWGILFHEPTVWQERNEHNLMHDFKDEIPGYLHNKSIGEALSQLSLKSGVENLGENLLICYEKLVRMEVIGEQELELVKIWLSDLKTINLPKQN